MRFSSFVPNPWYGRPIRVVSPRFYDKSFKMYQNNFTNASKKLYRCWYKRAKIYSVHLVLCPLYIVFPFEEGWVWLGCQWILKLLQPLEKKAHISSSCDFHLFGKCCFCSLRSQGIRQGTFWIRRLPGYDLKLSPFHVILIPILAGDLNCNCLLAKNGRLRCNGTWLKVEKSIWNWSVPKDYNISFFWIGLCFYKVHIWTG